MARFTRSLALRIAGGVALASLLIGCDPGVSLHARNNGASDVVIRHGTDRWLVLAHSAGLMFAELGTTDGFPASDYEVLKVGSCSPVATVKVDFNVSLRLDLVVGDGTASVGAPSPQEVDGAYQPLAKPDSATCPGPADGWTLFVVNHTGSGFKLRTRVEGVVAGDVAGVTAHEVGAALVGVFDKRTVDLMDGGCNVLDSVETSGWGDFTATIDGQTLTIATGRPDSAIESGTLTQGC